MAAQLWPASLRSWSERREERLGVPEGRLHYANQYIDDKLAICLGRARALKCLMLYWEIMERIGLPVAEGKTQFGSTVEFLGLVLHLGHGRLRLNARKARLYDAWLTRVASLESVGTDELESLLCTVSYGTIAAPSARIYLRRPFAALRKAAKSKGSSREVKVEEMLAHDLVAIRDRFRTQKGAWFVAAQASTGHAGDAGATDACRTPGGYSGMGGICFKTRRFWWYRLSQRHASLRIHINVKQGIAEIRQALPPAGTTFRPELHH